MFKFQPTSWTAAGPRTRRSGGGTHQRPLLVYERKVATRHSPLWCSERARWKILGLGARKGLFLFLGVTCASDFFLSSPVRRRGREHGMPHPSLAKHASAPSLCAAHCFAKGLIFGFVGIGVVSRLSAGPRRRRGVGTRREAGPDTHVCTNLPNHVPAPKPGRRKESMGPTSQAS